MFVGLIGVRFVPPGGGYFVFVGLVGVHVVPPCRGCARALPRLRGYFFWRGPCLFAHIFFMSHPRYLILRSTDVLCVPFPPRTSSSVFSTHYPLLT